MSYFFTSRSYFYSFLFTIPLFFVYEISILFLSKDDIIVVRNGADFLMRNILESFDIYGLYALGFVFFFGFALSFIFFIKADKKKELKSNFLFFMFIESVLWSFILYLMLSKFMLVLMNPMGKMILQQVTLAIGAGIYEEFLFRVLLIAGLTRLLGFIFLWKQLSRKIVALIISGGIFSAFHFMGEYGDFFSMELFLLRFFAGIILGVLYLFRGFGITAYTHSIYDLIVLIRMTLA
ncbi:CPBP family intramembrane metalloprotease [Candidatus Marinimicrobia bacterium]|nr:CPBP family intramembrane metalloprotease [Candidatus Neomarinimicrobiota bacterium]